MKKQAIGIIILIILFAVIISFNLINHNILQNNKSGSQINNEIGLADENQSASINATENLTEEIFNPDYECMNDSQCNDTDICVNHTCYHLTCNYPLYAENHKCIGLSCVNNTDCQSNQICYYSQRQCIKLDCGSNEYADNHMCKKYACSSSSDCNGAECFYHKCLGGVNYLYFETIEIGNTRINGKRILDYTLLRNWDIGLFVAQTQAGLDNLNNTVLNINNTSIDFQKKIALLLVMHGLNPTDVRFDTIMQKSDGMQGNNTIYIKIIADDNKTGVSDDAWHLITLYRDNFTEKNNLNFKITPTGKMFIGGEEILSGVSINYLADKDGNQYMCVNETFYEGESKILRFAGDKFYTVEVKSVEYSSGTKYVYVSEEGETGYRISEGNTTKIDSLSVYAQEVYYDKHDMGSYATLGICYEQ